MINIDLSKHITTLGDHTIKAVSRCGNTVSKQSASVVYSRLATVAISENDAGGKTYDISTIDGGVSVVNGAYNILTVKEA